MSSAVEVRKRPGLSGERGGSRIRWHVGFLAASQEKSNKWPVKLSLHPSVVGEHLVRIDPALKAVGTEEKGEICLQQEEVC